MAHSTPLGPIWDNYMTSNACMAIAERTLADPGAARRRGSGRVQSPSAGEIDRSREELERLFVVALWATFERNILEYVKAGAIAQSRAHPRAFVSALNTKLAHEIEWWRFDEILDMLKSFVDGNLIGQVRQIKQLRDGIVHRNPRTSRRPDPGYAFRILTSVLEDVRAAV